MFTKSILFLMALAGAASAQTISHGEQIVPYGTSLTFNVGYVSNYVTLTGNVTSITVPGGAYGGQAFHLTLCQGSGGPYTAPATWANTTGITAIATTGCTRFHLVWDDPAGVWVSTIQGQAIVGPQGPAGAAATPNTASTPLVVSSNNISIPAATSSTAGYLSAADWTTFNNKQNASTANVTIAVGTLALATTSIAAYGCQAVTAGSINSAVAAGVLSTDSIKFTPNGSLKAVTGYVPSSAGGLVIVAYSTAGNVNFDVCNWTASAITPGAVSLNWEVTR